MTAKVFIFLCGLWAACSLAIADEPGDLRDIPLLLNAPAMTTGQPAPGKRVRQVLPGFEKTEIYHALYLPPEWKPDGKYGIIVEYAGNGPYQNNFGDACTGRLEDGQLGYAVAEAKGFIWLCLPFVNLQEKRNQLYWWGDADATVEYCIKAVQFICENYGGDPSRVILCGFSRGAIACNYIGLHNDQIAGIWLAFVVHSHYDGVLEWNYPASDRKSARDRLMRLNGRAQFISHEMPVDQAKDRLVQTKEYLAQTGIDGNFTFLALAYKNHRDDWMLRDTKERNIFLNWLDEVLSEKSGTVEIRGKVIDPDNNPVKGVRVQSGPTHWTVTDEKGNYQLQGLPTKPRTISVIKDGIECVSIRIAPSECKGKIIDNVNLTIADK